MPETLSDELLKDPKNAVTKESLDGVLLDRSKKGRGGGLTVTLPRHPSGGEFTGPATTYTDGTYRVSVHWTGMILVEEGDWVSKYSCAMNDGDPSQVFDFERLREQGNGHSFEPLEDPNEILSGEVLFHGRTREECLLQLHQALSKARENADSLGAKLRERLKEFEEALEARKPYVEKLPRRYADWFEEWSKKGNKTARAFAGLVLCQPIWFLALLGLVGDTVSGGPVPSIDPYPTVEEIDGLDRGQVEEFLERLREEVQGLENLIWFLSGS